MSVPMRAAAALILAGTLALTTNGRAQNAVESLSLADAVLRALGNHPGARLGDLGVERRRSTPERSGSGRC